MQIDQHQVRSERERRAWSQEHLAQAAGLGLRTIQRIESGGHASFESALAIASALEVSVDELAAKGARREQQVSRKRIGLGFAMATGLVAAVFVARFALAEQYQVDLGVNVNGGDQDKRALIIDEGEQATLQFDGQLKTVIEPSVVDVNGREKVSVSLKIYERDESGNYALLQSPDLVHEDGGRWEIKISGTPLGKSYRLVVESRKLSS